MSYKLGTGNILATFKIFFWNYSFIFEISIVYLSSKQHLIYSLHMWDLKLQSTLINYLYVGFIYADDY